MGIEGTDMNGGIIRRQASRWHGILTSVQTDKRLIRVMECT